MKGVNISEEGYVRKSQEGSQNLKASIISDKTKEVPTSTLILILISMHFLWAGQLYNFDMPQLFESIIIETFGVSTVQVDFLYSLVGMVSIVMTSLGSVMITKVGLGFGAILFNAGGFIGLLLCYLATETDNFAYMIVGRILYGIAEEVVMVVQISIAEKWFSGKFLTVAVGLNRFVAFAGMSFAAYFQPQLFIIFRSFEAPLFFYALACFSTVVASLIYYGLELRNEHKLGVEDERNAYLQAEFGFKDLGKLSKLAWLLPFILCFSVNTYYLFDANGTDCLMNRYGFEYSEAKNLMTLLPIFGMIMTPLFSVVILKIGKKGFFFVLCGLFAVSANLMLFFLPVNPGDLIYAPLALYGLFYGLYNALVWSAMALVVPKQAVNLFLSIGVGIMSIGLTLIPFIAGILVKDRDVAAYQKSILLQTGMSVVLLLLGLVVARLDLKSGKLLHLPENDERVNAQRERMSRRLFELREGPKSDYKSFKSSGIGGTVAKSKLTGDENMDE